MTVNDSDQYYKLLCVQLLFVLFASRRVNLFQEKKWKVIITSGYGHSALGIREEMMHLISPYYSFIYKKTPVHCCLLDTVPTILEAEMFEKNHTSQGKHSRVEL